SGLSVVLISISFTFLSSPALTHTPMRLHTGLATLKNGAAIAHQGRACPWANLICVLNHNVAYAKLSHTSEITTASGLSQSSASRHCGQRSLPSTTGAQHECEEPNQQVSLNTVQ